MLKNLKLTNFRKVRECDITFDPGMTIIRAPNEGGKSTRIEGMLYALFGSRALRTSVDDAVTWGENPRSLKAQATLQFGGEDYTFARSKAGAEVIKDGQVFVTGQNEVTAFAARLIGADATTATNLMLANQANMRGALEHGPKAASELVEGLAEFSFFDHLLDRMQERLALGSDAHLRQRLESAQARIDGLRVDAPDTKQWEALIAQAPARIATLQAQIENDLRPAHDTARQALEQAKNNRSTYDLLNSNLAKVQRLLDDARSRQDDARSRAIPVDTTPIKALEAELSNAQDLGIRRKVFESLAQLNAAYPLAYWEGNASTLNSAIAEAESDVGTIQQQVITLERQAADIERDIGSLTGQIQEDDHCKTCGQLLQNHKEIAARNATLREQVKTKTQTLIAVSERVGEEQRKLTDARANLKDLKDVLASAEPFDAFLRTGSPYVDVDDQFVPARITWKGPKPPVSDIDPDAIRRQIADIQSADEASRKAAAIVESLTTTVADYEAQIAELSAQITAYDVADLSPLEQAAEDAQASLVDAQEQINRINTDVRDAEHQIAMANQVAAQQQAAIDETRASIEACHKDIADLGFNNALLRKVRAARPEVTNKLWNLVLASVSTMFTQMRGVTSVITRSKDGFLVNGETAASLSGSAQDLLGIAIRCALTKTFLPDCNMLILDEPAASMSQERTERLLAFLQTTGFAQVILITHEEVSSHLADQLLVV